MQVVVDNLITNYHQSGSGKLILLLPGWAETLASFHDLQAALEQKYQVVSLDLPGFGQTQAPPSPWDLTDYAKFIQAFLEKIKLKPHGIIGHSNGGAIAVRGLSKDVLSSDWLVMLAASGIRGEYKGRNKTLRVLTKTGKALSSPLPDSLKRRLRLRVYKTVGSDMLIAEHMQASFKKIINDDIRIDAKALKLPVLLLYGDKDESTPLSYGKRLNDLIKNSQLEEISPAGHFLHHDQPEQVLGKIKEFLK